MANEKRLDLIDRGALIEKKRQYCCGHGEYGYMVELFHIENAPTVDAVHVEELERILSTTPGLELWDYQKRGIMSAVKRLCGKADAMAELVRCKDCKHYREGFCFHENWWKDDGFTEVGETDFCSYGERRTGE